MGDNPSASLLGLLLTRSKGCGLATVQLLPLAAANTQADVMAVMCTVSRLTLVSDLSNDCKGGNGEYDICSVTYLD